jgi:hypothetical protein
MKRIILASLLLLTAGCGGAFETTIVRKDIVESRIEYRDCRNENSCSEDGFIQVTIPKCYRLGFSDLGGEILACVPKKVWDRTELGEVWHDKSMEDKSR